VAGGGVAQLQAHAGVEMMGLQHEAAGLGLGFMPLVLGPSAVGALAWVLGDALARPGRRPMFGLVGALLGALTAMPLVALVIEHGTPLWALFELVPREARLFVQWPVLSLPVGATAAVGHLLMRR
jgi:hypothetical protein